MRLERALTRPIVWVLTFALALAGLSVAAPANADAVGGISGVVTGPDGEPLDDGYIMAIRWNPDSHSWAPVAHGYTGDDGHYDIPGLDGGRYRLRFSDGSGHGYLPEYWDDVPTFDASDEFDVEVGQVSVKDAQLTGPGSISGTVSGVDDDPIAKVSVTAYRWDDARESWETATSADTDTQGEYEIDGLYAGSYQLRFHDESGRGYLEEYWDDAPSLATAEDVTVAAGQSVTDTDAQLRLGGRISGVVTGTDDLPLAGVTVRVYHWDAAEEDWLSDDSTGTADDGHYDVTGLTSGTYRLEFADDNGIGYFSEYWDDATSLDTSTDIPVVTGQVVDGTDAQLTEGGRITGTVTDAGLASLDDIGVTAYRWDEENRYWGSWRTVQTDADGDYEIGGLPAGDYRLRFKDDNGTYLTEYWDDSTSLHYATTIAVATGQTASGKDAELSAAARITGAVTASTGGPARSIRVAAFRWDQDAKRWAVYAWDTTDSDGTYDLAALPADTYRLRFQDQSYRGLLTEYWDDAATVTTATSISVAPGETAADIDAELAAGGHITGTVTLPSGEPADQIYVTAYRWDVPSSSWMSDRFALTDADGRYDVNGLISGTYRLGFGNGFGSDYATEYWDDATTLGAAEDIVITAGQTSSGKDAELSANPPEPTIAYLTLPTIYGTPQVGAPLTATIGTWTPSTGVSFEYRWLVDGQPVAGATTPAYVPAPNDVGKTVRFEVTASMPGSTTVTATSVATATVAPADPPVGNGKPPTLTGTPRVGRTVTATPGTWNPASATLSYQWLVAGTPVAYATTSSYRPVAADVGKPLQVRVTASAAGHTASSVASLPVTVRHGILTATKKPRVTGRAKQNATLKVSPGAWSPSKVTVTYRWYAGAKAIPKATAAKLKLAGRTLKTVAGKAISVRVTVTAPGYDTVTTRLRVPGRLRH